MSPNILSHNIALKASLLICGLLSVSSANAEYFGSLNGRTAKLSTQSPITVEATLSKGDYANVDYQQQGIRFNFQYSPKIVLFGDIGEAKLSSKNDNSFGIGAYYSFGRSLIKSFDSALKVSFHKVSFGGSAGSVRSSKQSSTKSSRCRITPAYGVLGAIEYGGYFECPIGRPSTTSSSGSAGRRGGGGNIQNIAIELLVSGELPNTLLGDRANWYANGGIQLLDGGPKDDTVFGIGAGVVVPWDKVDVYAGIEFTDDPVFGVGVRYSVE